MDHERLHKRVRVQGVNPLVYWLLRAVLQPFFHIYFRLSRIGREHIPAEGPVIIAANHRSFIDPFVIGCMARRPMYYVAKKEIFAYHPVLSWLLSALGAFPVDRGAGDQDMIETAKTILARGEIVLIFPEGTRTRPGSLGHPKRGVGRLALASGAPVVPLAVIGTEDIRRGWRLRPRKVRIRAGRPLRFPQVDRPSPALAGAVTDRIWPCVMLQWEWLGGLPPLRRVAIIGAGSCGTSLAVSLAHAGLEVDLGCRTHEQAAMLTADRENSSYLPGVRLPDAVRAVHAAELRLGDHDLICLAVPAGALPNVVAAHGEQITPGAGVLVLSKGLVPPLGSLPSAFVSERCHARAVAALGGPSQTADVLEHGTSLVLASLDRGFARQLADAFDTAGLDISLSSDVTGVELAGCAKNVAALALTAAATAGPNAAGAVAGKVFAEVDAIARRRGGRAETFAGLAGTGDLVATLVGQGSSDQRAGELLSQGVPPGEIKMMLAQAAEAVDCVPLLAAVARSAHLQTPAIDSLTALIEGRIAPERWTAAVTAPVRTNRTRPVRAA
jgi:glycerol-3-phosphate dehydrogenase (NAD(P)+)